MEQPIIQQVLNVGNKRVPEDDMRWATQEEVYSSLHEGGCQTSLMTSLLDLLKVYVQGENHHRLCHYQSKTRSVQGSDCAATESDALSDLPVQVQLEIMSYLGPSDLCRVSQVSTRWNQIASDDILWHHKLETDVHSWSIISHSTNPLMFLECHSEWSHKEIYLRCCPHMNPRREGAGLNPLTTILLSILPKRTPKLVMFGPGLESSTSLLVPKILQDNTGLFKQLGMFPGQFEGLGSGFKLNMNDSTFNLITLYTSTKAERQSVAPQDRLQHNRLLTTGNSATEEKRGVRKPVRDLCRTVDGFIFVVDSTQPRQTVEQARTELWAMVEDSCGGLPRQPLVVLSCVPSLSHAPRLSCIQLVEALHLHRLARPWQLHSCQVDHIDSVVPAIQWGVQAAQSSHRLS